MQFNAKNRITRSYLLILHNKKYIYIYMYKIEKGIPLFITFILWLLFIFIIFILQQNVTSVPLYKN